MAPTILILYLPILVRFNAGLQHSLVAPTAIEEHVRSNYLQFGREMITSSIGRNIVGYQMGVTLTWLSS